MGRTRTKKNVAVKQTENRVQQTKEPSINALLEKAQSLVVQCNYDLAKQFIRRVLKQQPAHVEAREILGVVLLETGEVASAKDVFLSLIPPDANAPSPPPPSPYLYLAQLSEDDPREALRYYQAAVDILSSQLKGKERAIHGNDKADEVEIKINIVRALVGQVEIWMDPSYDLCFEPEAESTCENLITLALKADPGNAEALQALASVRLSQQRPDDAKECVEKAWINWKDLDLEDARVPPIATRLGLVKLFLELHLFNPALQVLQGILCADDREVEAWYLEGWCFFLMAEQAKENGGKLEDLSWQELAKDSRDCLETCRTHHINENHPDMLLLEHAKELIVQLEALGIGPSSLQEDDGEEGEWKDTDGSEDSDGDVQME